MSSIAIAVLNQFVENLLTLRASDKRMSQMSALAQLHQAVSEDDVARLDNLVQSGGDVNSIYQQETAFTRALDLDHQRSAEIILAASKFDPNAKNQFDRSPLFVAAKQGHPDFVRRLVNMKAKVDEPDVRGVTPLGACAWKDSSECAKMLLDHGADVNRCDIMGQTTLFRACSNVSVKVAKLLIKQGCDVNICSKEGKSPLMEALPNYYSYKVAGKKISDMLEMCQILIDAGSDVDYQDPQGRTALHHTLDSNDPYGLCLLAESGAQLEIEDNIGLTPFQAAILSRRPHYEAARFLLYYGADARRDVVVPSGDVQNKLRISPLSIVLSKSDNLDLESKWSRSLLLRSLWAAVYPNAQMKRDTNFDDSSQSSDSNLTFHEIIERDILAWLHDSSPCSLQHQARLAIRSHIQPTNILPKIGTLPIGARLQQEVSLGLDKDKIPPSKICQLHCCILDGDTDRVKQIVEMGVDVNFPIDNKTPLALALEKGDADIMSVLLRSARNQERLDTALNADGDTVLHVAAKFGRGSVVSEVLDSFEDVNVKNAVGYTPLQEAVMAGHFDIAALLVRRGADISMSTIGDIPSLPILHLAAASGARELVELLLDMGVSPNEQDKFGNTALHVAASKGAEYLSRHISLPALYEDPGSANVDAVRMMLMGGQPSLSRRLPGHVMVAYLLVDAGTDVTMLNDKNKTPLMCAQEVNAGDMEEICSKRQ